MSKYLYSGKSDVGYAREYNEDYIQVIELDENNLFAMVLDGTGSKGQPLKPAAIVSNEISLLIHKLFDQNKELFLENAELFLDMFLSCANRVLGGFKLGNEDMYGGYASAITCCLLDENQRMTFAHAGNTRLYLLRENKKAGGMPVLKQLTKDHTSGAEMVDMGEITQEEYHTHPGRLNIYSGMGVIANPLIQTFSTKLKKNDIILMTTDGIHCAIRPEIIAQFILQSENTEKAAETLILGAKTVKYVDNMSAVIIWNPEV